MNTRLPPDFLLPRSYLRLAGPFEPPGSPANNSVIKDRLHQTKVMGQYPKPIRERTMVLLYRKSPEEVAAKYERQEFNTPSAL